MRVAARIGHHCPMQWTHDPDKYERIFRAMKPEEVEAANRRSIGDQQKTHREFSEAYDQGNCFMCGCRLDEMRAARPCPHWLLRRCNFRKQQTEEVAQVFGYGRLAAFLRWCANKERSLANINDLLDETREGRAIHSTVRWKNVEWAFECSEGDLNGHAGTRHAYPHYHLQMKLDGRMFIKFNDFHLPLTDHDQFVLSLRNKEWFRHGFGQGGAGMQDLLEVDPDLILETTTGSSDEETAALRLHTIVEADGAPISGDDIHDAIEEARTTGRSVAYVLQQKLAGKAKVFTSIGVGDGVPQMAHRGSRSGKSKGQHNPGDETGN